MVGKFSFEKVSSPCPLPPSLPPSLRPFFHAFHAYQCKKMGVRPFRQTKSVSSNSITLESVNNKHHKPEAPSPFIICGGVHTVSLNVWVAENHNRWGTIRMAPSVEKTARKKFQYARATSHCGEGGVCVDDGERARVFDEPFVRPPNVLFESYPPFLLSLLPPLPLSLPTYLP